MPEKAKPESTKPRKYRAQMARFDGRQEAADQGDAGDADRHVDDEDPVPGKIGGEETAQGRAGHRPDHARDGQPGHGVDQLVARRGPQQHQPRDRRHHRRPHALQRAGGHEGQQRIGKRAAERADHKDADGHPEHISRPEAVGDPAADRNADGERDKIRREGKLQRDRIGADIGRDGRQRCGDHRGIHLFHEQGHGKNERRKRGHGGVPGDGRWQETKKH